VSAARACALRVVRRVFEQGAYADRALAAEAAELAPRDRALATRIAYGTVQRCATLDHVAERFVSRPLAGLEPAVLNGLRVGMFQLLFLDGVPPYAAVDETVELVKRHSPGGARLLNAVLRRVAQGGSAVLAELSDQTPAEAALMHSVPPWLAELWWQELGPTQARALLAHINQPAESALRINSLVGPVAQTVSQLPVSARLVPDLPEAVVLEAPFDVRGSELWAHGAIMAQSRASMRVARVVAPEPGQRVLDLCAAPGGKTTHMAGLMDDRGRVVAVERHPGRAEALKRTCHRMRAGCVRVLVQDAVDLAIQEPFDRVLVDPPCSGLGTLQARPDRRWRAEEEAIDLLAALQAQILAAGVAATAPDGRLTYSVCTISEREGRGVIDAFLAANPGWDADDLGAAHPQLRHPADGRYLQLLPHLTGSDGFFISRLRRRGPGSAAPADEVRRTLPSSP
jgi:16S rRNA (cytosine967-C5)-methyltransferase